MKHYEIFDGRAYILTVMPSEDPWEVLEEERRARHNPRLRMTVLRNGIRTEVEGPSVFVQEEEDFSELYDEEQE